MAVSAEEAMANWERAVREIHGGASSACRSSYGVNRLRCVISYLISHRRRGMNFAGGRSFREV